MLPLEAMCVLLRIQRLAAPVSFGTYEVGEGLAYRVEETRCYDVRLRAQRRQGLLGSLLVVELQRRARVEPQDLRHRFDPRSQSAPLCHHVVADEGGTGEEECHPGRDHDGKDQLLSDRCVSILEHSNQPPSLRAAGAWS